MTGFDPSQHPRNTDGKFATKTGAAAEASLTETYPSGFPVDGTTEAKIEWAFVNSGTPTVEVDGRTRELGGPLLKAS